MTGPELKAARKRLGLSLSELSEMIGKDRQTLHNYEQDKAPIPHVVALAVEHLECKPKRTRNA